MANTIVMTVTDSLTAGIDADKWTVSDAQAGLNSLANQMMALASGSRSGTLVCVLNNGNAVRATQTVTFSNAGTANDTVIVNGVTFTCKNSGAGANEFNKGSTASDSATNLAAAITASVTALVSGYVTASMTSAGVCTVQAVQYGVQGNFYTIAEGVDGGSVITVGGARLAGGTAATNGKTYGVS